MPSDLPPPPPPPLPPPPPSPPAAASGAALTDPPRRLHPFSLVRGISLRQVATGLIPLFALISGEGLPVIAIAGIVLAVLAVTAVIRLLGYQRHTYELTGGRIIERSGIISRHERALEIARIQQIDSERTILDRIVGTCELRLETAADSGDSELQLKVVSVAEAARLRALLEQGNAADRTPEHDVPAAAREATGLLVPDEPASERAREVPLVAVSIPRVAFASITGPRLIAIPATIAVVVSIVGENAAIETVTDRAGDLVTSLGAVAIGMLIIAGILLSLVVTAVTGVLRDGGFTISQRGTDLIVRRGLTTTRTATVPLRRVQRVTVHRRWLHARFGFASVTVHSAGGGGAGNDGNASAALDRSLTVPLMPEADVETLVRRLLAVEALPALAPHPPAARRRAVLGAMFGAGLACLPILGASVVFREPLGVLVVPLFLGAAAWSGVRRYGWMASGHDGRAVSMRTGLLGSTVEVSPLRKTQGSRITSTILQRRRDLASVQVHVAGPAGGLTIVDVAQDTARQLCREVLAEVG